MLYIGADHAGFHLKERVKMYFERNDIPYRDVGNIVYDSEDDYPDFAFKVAKRIKHNDKGILFCGSSFGICIAANKFKGIRAVSIREVHEAVVSRLHNDANVLCLSGWHMPFAKAKRIINVWLKTKFSNKERHIRRLKKIWKIEQKWK